MALAVLASAIGAGTALGDADPPAPLVSGVPQEGETLVAGASDPSTPPDRFRWQRCDPDAAVCDGAGGENDPEWTDITGATAESYTLGGADVHRFVRVLAKYTSLGSKWASSEPVGPIVPASAPPPPPLQPAGGLSPPIAHQTANLFPEGTILIHEPGEPGFRPISEAEQVQLGTVVDARGAHVNVHTARNEQNVEQSAEFWAGVFKLDQTEKGPLFTTLKLVGGPKVRRASRVGPAVVAERRRGGRRVWGRGKCKCRTRGRHSSGTVRGTWWLTAERRKGTLTKVKRGVVEVKDFDLGEKVKVKAGKKYLARAKRKR
jgi:hypothetical protein